MSDLKTLVETEGKVADSTPINAFILVRRDGAESVTPGGIILPDESKEEQRPFFGEVVRCGPGKRSDKNAEWPREPVSVLPGDRVIYRKYRGIEFEEDGENYIFLEQDEILAIL